MRRTRRRLAAAATVAALASPLMLGACGSDSAGPTTQATQAGTPTVSAQASPTGASPTTGGPQASAVEDGPEPGYDRTNFADSTTFVNRWIPWKPGTQYIYEGHTVEDGERIPHRLIITVTDLTKTIDGVRNIVLWDRDYSGGELVEAELSFFAQADNGDVWHFGEYPEEYEGGKFVKAPTWIHGLKGAQAGITLRADPKLTDPSHAQGWGPEVGWTDRARVHQVNQRTCVPAGCYNGVLVADEGSKEEPDAHQFKYYAPGVGNVRVGYGGQDPTRETLQLVKIIKCTPQQRAKARAEARKLERHAYQVSKAVYARTAPLQ